MIAVNSETKILNDSFSFTPKTSQQIKTERVAQRILGSLMIMGGLGVLVGLIIALPPTLVCMALILPVGPIPCGVSLVMLFLPWVGMELIRTASSNSGIDASNLQEIQQAQVEAKKLSFSDLLSKYEPWEIFYYQLLTPQEFQSKMDTLSLTFAQKDLPCLLQSLRNGIDRAKKTEPLNLLPKVEYPIPRAVHHQTSFIEWNIVLS
jgi:hypothetical protein